MYKEPISVPSHGGVNFMPYLDMQPYAARTGVYFTRTWL